MTQLKPFLEKVSKQTPTLLILGSILLYFGLFYCQYIVLHTADIGRFIVNGREIFAGNFWSVVTTNYYSYTHANFTYTNHHWLYGVFVYSIHQVGGFPGLTLFNAGIATMAFGILLTWSYKKHGLWPTVTAGLISLPLIVSRSEVRPETLSLLGLALYFVTLENVITKKISTKWLWISLLSMQLIWQNTHLFFVLGLLLIFIFWLYALITKKTYAIKHLGMLGIAAGLLTTINPNGLRGAVMPFRIFNHYGYAVAENQSLLFMLQRFAQPLQYYELALTIISSISALIGIRCTPKKKRSKLLLYTSLFMLFAIATFAIIRLESFWGLIAIPFIGMLAAEIYNTYHKYLVRFWTTTIGAMTISTLGFVALIAAVKTGLYSSFLPRFGFGTYPGTEKAAQFIIQNNISGPIFNNYDIGGYLIYSLYPEYAVFVDNRPEAYPVDFFADTYIAPQENVEAWKRISEQYTFNLVVFYRHDLTPWGQKALINLVKDDSWIPVFVDAFTLIFVKDVPQNQEVIERYQLPAEMFAIPGE